MADELREQDTLTMLMALPMYQRLLLSQFDWKQFGFTKAQLTIFLALLSHQSLTMTEIAGYLSSSKEQATRAVAPLVDRGYLRRSVDRANRTRVHVQLTDQGREFLRQEEEQVRAYLGEKFRCLDETDREALRGAVQTTLRILRKME